jgi:hypothetical protein
MFAYRHADELAALLSARALLAPSQTPRGDSDRLRSLDAGHAA